MSDENTTESTETEVQSIEQIAAEFKLTGETETQKTQPQQVVQETTAEPAPDPVTDPERFRTWLDGQNKRFAELQTSQTQTLTDLQSERDQLRSKREESELNALVDKIHGEMDGVPKKLVKYALADRYNNDPAFKAILDNREKAPQALEKAIGAVVPDFKKDFAIKADPQIAEDQRAMSDGMNRSSTQTTSADDGDMKMLRMPPAEFDQTWERIKTGR